MRKAILTAALAAALAGCGSKPGAGSSSTSSSTTTTTTTTSSTTGSPTGSTSGSSSGSTSASSASSSTSGTASSGSSSSSASSASGSTGASTSSGTSSGSTAASSSGTSSSGSTGSSASSTGTASGSTGTSSSSGTAGTTSGSAGTSGSSSGTTGASSSSGGSTGSPLALEIVQLDGTVGPAGSVRYGATFAASLVGRLADGGTVPVSVDGGPGAVMDNYTGVLTFTPGAAEVGTTRHIAVEAQAGALSASADLAVAVQRGLALRQQGVGASDASPAVVDANGHRYLLIPDGLGLAVVEVTGDQVPSRVTRVDTSGAVNGVTVVGTWAFLADGRFGLGVVDISDPTNPQLYQEIFSPSAPAGAAAVWADAAANRVFLSMDDGEVRVFDVGLLSVAPTHDLGWFNIDLPYDDAAGIYPEPQRGAVAGNLMYVPDRAYYAAARVHVIDLSAANGPAVVATYDSNLVGTYGFGDAAAVHPFNVGPSHYLALNTGALEYVETLQVDDPLHPAKVGEIHLDPGVAYLPNSALHGTTLYVTDLNGATVHVVDLSTPATPTKLGELAVGLTNPQGVALSADGTRAYTSLPAHTSATYDASAFSQLAVGQRGVVYGPEQREGDTVARLEGNTLYVYDVSGGAPVEQGHLDGAGYLLALRGTLALTADNSADFSTAILRVIDLTDRANPAVVGTLSVPHPAAIAYNTARAVNFVPGTNLALFTTRNAGVAVVDLTTPAAPTQVALLVSQYDNGSGPQPGSNPAHNNAVSDGRYVYLASGNTELGFNGLQIFDLGSPLNPAAAAVVSVAGFSVASAEGMVVDATRHLLYVANANNPVYRLRVVDVSNPASPTRVAQVTNPEIGGLGLGRLLLTPNHLIAGGDGLVLFPLDAGGLPGTPEVLDWHQASPSRLEGEQVVVSRRVALDYWYVCADPAGCTP